MALTLALLEGLSIFGAGVGVAVLRLGPSELGWRAVAPIASQAAMLASGSVTVFYLTALYDPRTLRSLAEWGPRLPRALVAVLVLASLLQTRLAGAEPLVPRLISIAGTVVGPMVLLRVAWSAMTASRLFLERIVVLGVTPLAERLIREINGRPESGWLVVGVVDDLPVAAPVALGCPLLGPCGRLTEIVREVRPHRIVVALAERRGRTPVPQLLESCVARGIVVEDAAACYERLTGTLLLESLTPTSIVFSGRFRPSALHLLLARGLSLLVAIVGLVALVPVLGMIALAIKLDSRGPVLFVQQRVGAHGRPFKLLKFRTMQVAPGPRSEWAGDNGDCVTRAGKWLRALRLDELPQFINILRGEMNLVGPRPHPVSNLELFTLVTRNLNETTGTAVSYYTLRSMVRPGLTGWAQVRYGYANNLDEEIEKLRYDLYYVKHMSLWLDLRILVETPKVLLSGRLADGTRVADDRGHIAPAGPFRFAKKVQPTRAA